MEQSAFPTPPAGRLCQHLASTLFSMRRLWENYGPNPHQHQQLNWRAKTSGEPLIRCVHIPTKVVLENIKLGARTFTPDQNWVPQTLTYTKQ